MYAAVLARGLSEKCKGVQSPAVQSQIDRAVSDVPAIRLRVRIHKEYHSRNKDMFVWGKMYSLYWCFG